MKFHEISVRLKFRTPLIVIHYRKYLRLRPRVLKSVRTCVCVWADILKSGETNAAEVQTDPIDDDLLDVGESD